MTAQVLLFDVFYEKDPHLNAVELLAFFNLRQKVYIFIYLHIDINKIYKSKEAGQLLF